jgi:SAM-dependent methyltransferase
MPSSIRGTQGYAEEAEDLLVRYESFDFEDAHRAVLHLLPGAPGKVLDIGAGTGRDAAYFAAKGHRVTAVEPTDALRIPASELHPSRSIEWIDDGLPELKRIVARREQFDLILMSAVWMHLDAAERRRALPIVAPLLGPGGTMIMTLRHGPVPEGRRMFAVSAEEIIGLAEAEGLKNIFNRHAKARQEANRQSGVTWTTLVFENT